MILIFRGTETDERGVMEVRSYPNTTAALRALFELEQAHPGMDVVLVKSERPEDVREAFRNYFSDARQFIKLIGNGSRRLLKNVEE